MAIIVKELLTFSCGLGELFVGGLGVAYALVELSRTNPLMAGIFLIASSKMAYDGAKVLFLSPKW